MIELVMVIVVLGILASLALPRLERDHRQEAGDSILSAIRHTQHLALMDNKTDPSNATWQKRFWHIRFEEYGGNSPVTWFYSVSSSRDGDTNIDSNEVALDPANGLLMNNSSSTNGRGEKDSPSVFISENFGINNIVFTGGCSDDKHIAFDHLGRPHVNIYSAENDFRSYMTDDCTITFEFEVDIDDVSITIRKETGDAFIVGQANS